MTPYTATLPHEWRRDECIACGYVVVVDFPKTTDYHWPHMDKNTTREMESDGEISEVEGPFGFGAAVKIVDGVGNTLRWHYINLPNMPNLE